MREPGTKLVAFLIIFLSCTISNTVLPGDGTTGIVSVDSAGIQGNGFSELPSISPDGRYVAFYSYATNLVPDDTDGATDVFVRVRINGGDTLFESSFEGDAVLGGFSPEADK